jgi:hypothetical protein
MLGTRVRLRMEKHDAHSEVIVDSLSYTMYYDVRCF